MIDDPDFTALIGKTLTGIDARIGEDEVTFECSDGERYQLYHTQDCCESVTVENIKGDVGQLIGEPITYAEQNATGVNPEGEAIPKYQDSFTWTTFRLDTAKGRVVIRWYGESNGYYSEDVYFRKL